jgi:hypothetical protein
MKRLLNADRALQAKVFALLDVRATITERGDQVKVRLEGSVAHDLLLAGVRDDLAPNKLASGGQPAECRDDAVPPSAKKTWPLSRGCATK